MDSYMSIFNGILSTDGTFLDIYLNGLDEHRKFSAQNSDEAGLLQHITSLMTTAKTRILGLRLLDKLLDDCSADALEKKGNLWMILVLKACNNQELERDAHIIFQVLNKLIKSSQNAPDMAKSFVNSHISKVYESASNVPAAKTKYALKCMETCLRSYPGSSGPSRGVIEKLLWKNIDHVDYEVVQSCGKCLHLLQQVKGGGVQGVNYKSQWKNYQLQLLGGIHNVYNAMFTNCSEIYDDKIEEGKLSWESELIEFDDEPVKRTAQIYIRCRNLLAYLSIALREPFPVEKSILLKKILNAVVRGLSVNCLMLEKNPIADNIALSVLLPNLHIDLFNLLDVVVRILRGHALPYAELILGLTMDSLKWTSTKNFNGNEKNLLSLRKKVYETITLWCKMFNSGSLCEVFAEHMFNEILDDIRPNLHEFTLKVLSGARKHMTKKARRQLQSVQTEKPKTPKTQSDMDNEKQQELCVAALCCLHEIITSVGNFLKPTVLKMIQTSIIKISASFYELPQRPLHLYNNLNCRIEIYNVLYSILMATHYLCPPPTELVLAIIQTAYARDKSFKVRSHCGVILKNIEKLVHPQKESLLFTIEARDIRNTFIKMGQENLLHDFGLNVSTLINDVVFDEDTVLEVSSSVNSPLEHDNERQDNNIPPIPTNEKKILDAQVSNSTLNEINNQMLNSQEVDNSTLTAGNGEKIIIASDDDIDSNNALIQVSDSEDIDSNNALIQVSDSEEIISKLDPTTNIDLQPKSPAIILAVEDDISEEAEDYLKNPATNEPEAKKQKLSDETNEADSPNSITELVDDEDIILEDIASQFVDELE